jgi:hypothetical protein
MAGEIPRRIHQLWIDPSAEGSRPPPADILDSVRQWSALNPGHAHRLWTLEAVLEECAARGRADVAGAIGQCRLPSMQADIARLFLLGAVGGFWSDLKLRPRVAIPPALHGFATVLAEHFPKPDLPDPAGLLVNGFMGAAPNAPVIAMALDLVLCNVARRQGDGVFAITGPGALTTAWGCYRLADPAYRHTVFVIPHRQSWGVLWDVGADRYNPPGLHWAERQRREPLFVGEEQPGQEPTGLFVAVPGHVTRIDTIPSRQGFYPFEPELGFAWADSGARPRIFFDARLPFDRLRMKLFVQEPRLLAGVGFRVNGMPAPAEFRTDPDGWSVAILGPFAVRPSWNELAIDPPGAPAPPAGGDRRRLGVALAWIQPFVTIA